MVLGVAFAFSLTVFAIFGAPVVGEAEYIEYLFSFFRFGSNGAASFLFFTQAVLNGDFEVEEDFEFLGIKGLVAKKLDGALADPVEVGGVFGLSNVVLNLRFHESKVALLIHKATKKCVVWWKSFVWVVSSGGNWVLSGKFQVFSGRGF